MEMGVRRREFLPARNASASQSSRWRTRSLTVTDAFSVEFFDVSRQLLEPFPSV